MNKGNRFGKYDASQVITDQDLMLLELAYKGRLNSITVDEAWEALELTSKLELVERLRAWIAEGKPHSVLKAVIR